MRKKGKNLRLFSVLTSLALFLTPLSGCAKTVSTADFSAFNTAVHVEVYDGKISDAEKSEIKTLLTSLEESFSASGSGSTGKFNSAEPFTQIETNDTFNEVYNTAKKTYEISNGKFDATVLPLVKLWKFYPDYPVLDFCVPAADEIEKVLKVIGFNKTCLTETNGKTFLSKTQDGVALDFGGIAKGYAADKIAEILKANGSSAGYVSVGTSSLNLLSVESLGVRHPEKSGEQLIKINLSDVADVSVSTSGNYEKFYEKVGKKYSHVINPATGYPADTGVLSVTVLCKDGALADCVTTALCLCNHDFNDKTQSELISLIKKFAASDELKSALFFAAASNGSEKQLITNAKENAFILYDKDYKIVFID